MNDDQRQLANAYLDREVTADEQARAEADPEVVAEVARIRAVREAMRVTERPDAARRDAAIRAALDTFEVRPAATIATTPELPVAPPAAKRQGRWFRPLSAAAAAVLVIAGGVLVLRDGGQDTDDDAASSAARELTATATELATAQDSDEASATFAAPAATAAADAAGELAAPEATAAAPSVLMSPADLAAFATAAMAADARTATDSASRCALGEWVGSAVYQRAGEQLTVDVFVDAGEAIAADPASCEVVARAQLP